MLITFLFVKPIYSSVYKVNTIKLQSKLRISENQMQHVPAIAFMIKGKQY